jgi:hypothetical protein
MASPDLLRVLVATTQTQGQRANDFSFTEEGELCRLSFVCDSDRGDPDGPCGCGRSLSGVRSGMANTTVRVALYNGGRGAYIAEIARSFNAAGYGLALVTAAEEADNLLAVAARYPVGAVLEWRRGETRERVIAPTSGDADADDDTESSSRSLHEPQAGAPAHERDAHDVNGTEEI